MKNARFAQRLDRRERKAMSPAGAAAVSEPKIEHLETGHAVVESRSPVVTEVASGPRARYWPSDKPLPTVIPCRAIMPCPQCRIVLLPSQEQAVRTLYTRGNHAFLECRDCGHKFRMVIAEPAYI